MEIELSPRSGFGKKGGKAGNKEGRPRPWLVIRRCPLRPNWPISWRTPSVQAVVSNAIQHSWDRLINFPCFPAICSAIGGGRDDPERCGTLAICGLVLRRPRLFSFSGRVKPADAPSMCISSKSHACSRITGAKCEVLPRCPLAHVGSPGRGNQLFLSGSTQDPLFQTSLLSPVRGSRRGSEAFLAQ